MLKPTTVEFAVPEDSVPQIMERVHSGAVLPVTAFDRANVTQLAVGQLAAVDTQVNTTTGTVMLRANFDNADERLFPSQFVNVVMLLDTLKDVVRVPVGAVQRGAPGSYVYLVDAENTVAVHPIKLGPQDGDFYAVESGLSPGDVVVTDGADRLRDGAKVSIPGPVQDACELPRRRAARGARTLAGPRPRWWGRRSRQRPAAPSAAGNEDQPSGPPPRGGQPPAPVTPQPPARRRPRPGRARPLEARMNPSRLFINLPVATSLLMVAILLSGLFAFKFLPLSSLPEVDYPTIQVQTFYPGASPEVMTSSVTAPLERQFGQMPGLNQMTSASSGGASVITLQFSLDLGLDVAEQEVQAAINAAGNVLPNDLPTPPTYAKFNPADAPIMTLAVTSTDAEAHRCRGSDLHAACAEDLAAAGRRRGEHLGRPAAGGAHPVQSARAREIRAQHRRSAHHHRERQRQLAQRQLRRSLAVLLPERERSDHRHPGLSGHHRRLQQRLGRAHVGRGQRDHGARRTPSSPRGRTAPSRSSSTFSASRAPT